MPGQRHKTGGKKAKILLMKGSDKMFRYIKMASKAYAAKEF